MNLKIINIIYSDYLNLTHTLGLEKLWVIKAWINFSMDFKIKIYLYYENSD